MIIQHKFHKILIYDFKNIRGILSKYSSRHELILNERIVVK